MLQNMNINPSVNTGVTNATNTTVTATVPTPESAIEELTKQMQQLSINYANLSTAVKNNNNNRPRNGNKWVAFSRGNNANQTQTQV